MTTLGLVAAGVRKIRSGKEYDHLFPKADGRDDVIIRNGSVKDTVHLMHEVVMKYQDDTKRLAPLLKGRSIKETCFNIWSFIYHHIQYKLDEKGLEQLRRPARSWQERTTGVDCDCYSIFISSILVNLHIPHRFRITRYDGDWQHVYVAVVIPQSHGSEYVMDCVLDQFDYEKPYSDKFHFNMTTLSGIPIAVLSGLGKDYDSELLGVISGDDFAHLEYADALGEAPDKTALDAIYKHLVRTRDLLINDPKALVLTGSPKAHLQMLNYAIESWNTPNRDKALDILAKEEDRWNEQSGLVGLGDDDEYTGLLGAPKFVKKFWTSVKDTVDNSKVKNALNKGVKAIVRYNPFSIAARNGFLLALKINLFGWARQLRPGLMDAKQANAQGLTKEHNNAVNALTKLKKLFVTDLQGKEDKLVAAIGEGQNAKNISGVGSLGDLGVVALTAVTAAVPTLLAAAKVMNEAGLMPKQGDGSKEGFFNQIKDWFIKNFGKASVEEKKEEKSDTKDDNTNPDNVDASAAPPTSPTPPSRPMPASRAQGAAVPAVATVAKNVELPQEEPKDSVLPAKNPKPADNTISEEGTWDKIKSFAKEHPVSTTIGTILVLGGLTLAISPAARRAVGLAPKKLPPNPYIPPSPAALPSTPLTGHRRKTKKHKRGKVKTILLK